MARGDVRRLGLLTRPAVRIERDCGARDEAIVRGVPESQLRFIGRLEPRGDNRSPVRYRDGNSA